MLFVHRVKKSFVESSMQPRVQGDLGSASGATSRMTSAHAGDKHIDSHDAPFNVFNFVMTVLSYMAVSLLCAPAEQFVGAVLCSVFASAYVSALCIMRSFM